MIKHDICIDILKFFAALLITNSHCDMLYPEDMKVLASGGAIGDVLFFFCSGYTLFLGRGGDFFNWYKRRIKRIYPTVFAWAAVASFVFGQGWSMKHTIMSGGGWFVSCIMIYYVVLWVVRRYFIEKLLWVFVLTGMLTTVVYSFFGTASWDPNIYGETRLKWIFYFMFMLLGASTGLRKKKIETQEVPVNAAKTIGLLFVSVTLFYWLCSFKTSASYGWVQLLSLLPLFCVTYLFYQLCNWEPLKRCYESKVAGTAMRLISGLCLEIYVVQYTLLHTSLTSMITPLFPLSLLLFFLYVLLAAYTLRCLARLFSQTFREGDYDWKAIIRI